MGQIPSQGMNWVDRVGAERTQLDAGPATLARPAVPDVEGLGEHIAAAMNEGVVVRLSSGDTVWHNPAVCRLLRSSCDDIGDVLDRLHERMIDVDGTRITAVHSPVTATLRTRLPVRNRVVGIEHDDGDTMWLSISSRPGERAGEFVAIISFTNVTEEERRRRELEYAVRHVNQNASQTSLPHTDRLQFALAQRGAQVSQRDFQSVFQVDPDRYGFYVGTVPADPTSAACIASLTHHTLRSAATLIDEPDDVLAHLENMVAAEWPGTTLSTTFGYVDIGQDGIDVRVSCAGAPPPALLNPDGVRTIGTEGPMIGVDGESVRPVQSLHLTPGDRLIVPTGGPASAGGEACDLPDLFAPLEGDVPIEELADAACALAVGEVVESGERNLTVLALGYD